MKKLCLFLMVLCLIGCENENVNVPQGITCSPSTLFFSNIGGSETVVINTSVQWSATIEANWLEITPDNGSGNSLVKITVSPGDYGESEVIFKAGKETASLFVRRGLEGLELNYSDLTLGVGDSIQLLAKLNSGKECIPVWTSSDSTVVNVDQNGMVIAVGEGSARILAQMDSLQAECSIVVQQYEMIITPSDVYMEEGETYNLQAMITPQTTSSVQINWNSSNNAVVTVDNNGKITAVSSGDAIISAEWRTLKAECKVCVGMESFMNNLHFNSVFISVADTICYGNDLITIQDVDETSYNVKKVKVLVGLFSSGFYMDDDFEFAGATKGALISAEGPMYMAPDWANNSDTPKYFIAGNWIISDLNEAQSISVGKTNERYISHMKLFLENLQAGDKKTAYQYDLSHAGSEGGEGATMTIYTYYTVSQGYPRDGYYLNSVPDMFITEGSFWIDVTKSTPHRYMTSIAEHHLVAKALRNDSIDNSNYFSYGCYWHVNADNSISWNDEEVHFTEPQIFDYNVGGSQVESPMSLLEIPCSGDISATRKLVEKIRRCPKAERVIRPRRN